jgi:hypothetical protein
MQHTCIAIAAYATSKMKHMKHTPKTHTPAWSSMPTVTRHENNKWRIQMWACAPLTICQGWSVHSMVTPRMHGPMRHMHPTLSEWSHALPSTDP